MAAARTQFNGSCSKAAGRWTCPCLGEMHDEPSEGRKGQSPPSMNSQGPERQPPESCGRSSSSRSQHRACRSKETQPFTVCPLGMHVHVGVHIDTAVCFGNPPAARTFVEDSLPLISRAELHRVELHSCVATLWALILNLLRQGTSSGIRWALSDPTRRGHGTSAAVLPQMLAMWFDQNPETQIRLQSVQSLCVLQSHHAQNRRMLHFATPMCRAVRAWQLPKRTLFSEDSGPCWQIPKYCIG